MTFTQLSQGLHALLFCENFFPILFLASLFLSLSPTMSPVLTQYMLMSSSIGLPDQAQPPIAICNLLIRLTMINNNIPKCGWEVRRGGNDGEDELLRDRYDLKFFLGFFFFCLLGLNKSSLSSLAALESPGILAFLFICQPISLSPTWLAGWSHGRGFSHSLLHLGENLHSNQKRRRHENLIIIINSSSSQP